MKQNYQKTMYACFIGYIVQAVVNNFVPLLFVTFQKSYGISLSKVTLLITINFCVQLLVDMLSAGFVDKIGYRASVIMAHIFAAAGLLGLTFLPDLLPNAYAGIVLSVVVYAIGGGLIEVLISPILEACPTENKEKAMSLLHSFYCWGHMGVVLLSTAFFALFGVENWKILTLLWVLIRFAIRFSCNCSVVFAPRRGRKRDVSGGIVPAEDFWIFLLMMLCAGASEQAVSQWASTFAEQGLGVTKTVGDLAGPMSFALLMGTARLIYGKFGDRLNLDRFMKYSCVLCMASYLCIVFVPVPFVGLLGCAVCGFSVGILWPGTFSKASAAIKGGGTAMFAMLALAGDVGCSGGPTLAGLVSSFQNDLHIGILAAIVFPVLLLVSLFLSDKRRKSIMK
ncbi:MAG: MFS transporter [Ruminococcus callidus]